LQQSRAQLGEVAFAPQQWFTPPGGVGTSQGDDLAGNRRRGVLTKDLLVAPAEFGGGIDAELVAEPGLELVEDRQGFGAPTHGDQCPHELPVRTFVVRLLGDHPRERHDDLVVAAESEQGLDAVRGGCRALLVQVARGIDQGMMAGEVAVGGPVPAGLCLVQERQ